jgi:lysyl-tRNA synthetase class 2
MSRQNSDDNLGSGLIGQRQERINKAEQLKKIGINPYPSKSNRTHYTSDVIDNFADLEEETVTVAGRMMSWREHGKIAFSDLQDSKGNVQTFIRSSEIADTDIDKQTVGFAELGLLDVGDIIQVKGKVIKTKTGEISVLAQEVRILAKAIRPLPEKWKGIKDKETLFRQRYLDMIMNPQHKWRFEKTAKILFAIRRFLNDRGFLEIKTPIIQPIYGGTNANPFRTHVRALDVDYYLAVAHELYLKRLIVAGFENVYNIVGYFRNEGIDRSHNPEFSMLETMTAYQNYEYNMELTEELYGYIADNVFEKTTFKIGGQDVDFGKPWQKLSMVEAVKKYADEDFDKVKDLTDAHKILEKYSIEDRPNSIGESLVKVFEEKVEEKLIQPTFIYGHPVEISPLAKTMDSDSRYVERFEIFIGGIEGGDNWTELNDPLELYERFKEQVERGRGGDDEAHPMDVEFLEAMEHGMPPTTGLGPGIERLAMMFTETDYIDDVIFFPMMKPAPITETQKQIYGEEYLIMDEKPEEGEVKFDLDKLPTVNLVTLTEEVKEKFDGIKFGYLVFEDVQVADSPPQLTNLKKQVTDLLRRSYENRNEVKAEKNIAGFRELYKQFGADPNSNLNSAEALLQRIISKKGIYNINNVVDTYNITSAELAIPMAAYDLDQIQGEISLSLAIDGDNITKIGDDEPTEIAAGELVYRDEEGVICMDYNYRDSERTKVRKETNRLIVFVDGHKYISQDEIRKAMAKIAFRLNKYAGANPVAAGYSWQEVQPISLDSNANVPGVLPTKEEAQALLEKYVSDDYQRLHARMVASGMEKYAEKLGQDKLLWYVTGLLHDLDYDQYPEKHPNESLTWFAEWGYPQQLIDAVAAHAWDRTGHKPQTELDKALVATDEMMGLIYAYSILRPGGFTGMKPKSIKKKFKDKSFAPKISREEIQYGIDLLGVEFADHVSLLIEACQSMSEFNT